MSHLLGCSHHLLLSGRVVLVPVLHQLGFPLRAVERIAETQSIKLHYCPLQLLQDVQVWITSSLQGLGQEGHACMSMIKI
jgi:hypothetical protein